MADSTADRERSGSTWHLLGMWILLGLSLFDLGTAVHRASTDQPFGTGTGVLGLSSIWAGLLAATAVVTVLWVAGVRPSLWACWTYLIAEQVLTLWLVLAFYAAGSGTPVGSWMVVGRDALSILLAAALVFSGLGKALMRTVRRRVRRWTAPSYRRE